MLEIATDFQAFILVKGAERLHHSVCPLGGRPLPITATKHEDICQNAINRKAFLLTMTYHVAKHLFPLLNALDGHGHLESNARSRPGDIPQTNARCPLLDQSRLRQRVHLHPERTRNLSLPRTQLRLIGVTLDPINPANLQNPREFLA